MEAQNVVLGRAARTAEPPRYLRTRDAAHYLGLAESTLLTWRREHRGPVPLRTSQNRCFYDVRALDDFMAQSATFERQPTAASCP